MRAFLALCFAVILGTAAPALAETPEWRVVSVSGTVRAIAPGAAAKMVQAGDQFRIGTVITTAGDGAVSIISGERSISLASNARITIAGESREGMTKIMQGLGSAVFQVDRKDRQHFRVETPLLAAVVKGTTFTVTAGAQEDVVHVAQGIVEVRANSGAAARDVLAGETARVARQAPGQLSMTTPASTAPALPGVTLPAIDYAAVSDNVLRGPETAAGKSLTGSAAGGAAAAVRNGDGFLAGTLPEASLQGPQQVAQTLSRADRDGGSRGSVTERPGNGQGSDTGANGVGNSGSAGNGSTGNSGNGNGDGASGNTGNPGNGNNGSDGPGNTTTPGNGNSGNGNSGSGNGNSGSDNNGNSGNGNAGKGNSGPGNNGDSGNDNNGNSGNGNNANGNGGNGNGNSGPGNANGEDDGGRNDDGGRRRRDKR